MCGAIPVGASHSHDIQKWPGRYDRNRGYIPLRVLTEQRIEWFRENEVRYAANVSAMANEAMPAETSVFRSWWRV